MCVSHVGVYIKTKKNRDLVLFEGSFCFFFDLRVPNLN